jgi:uncharacterized protein YrzB (UPF0473 family)
MHKNIHECGCSHNNDHHCEGNCDHEHGHDHNHDHHHPTIHLTLTDNSTMECDVLDIFEIMDKQYIALLPKGEENVLLYHFEETEEGPQLDNIESDEEYEAVGKAFMELMTVEEEE